MGKDHKKGPPGWADRILEWYCADYYLEEVQGDLHEWFAEQQIRSPRWLRMRYFILVIRYFSLTRSKSFHKLINNTNYLSMKNVLIITWRNLKKDKPSGIVRLANLTFGISIFLLALVYANYELNYDRYHENGVDIYRLGQDHGGDKAWAASPIGVGPFAIENIPDVKRMARFIPVQETWVQVEEEKLTEKRVFFADSSALTMFSYEMIQGNPRTALTDPFSIVITESMAKKYFGDKDPMGKTMQLLVDRGDSRIVTGVMKDVPAQSHLQFDFLCSIYSYGDEDYQRSWRNYFVYTFIESEKNDLEKIQELIVEEFRTRYRAGDDDYFAAVLTPLHNIHLYTSQEKDNADHGSIYHIYILFSIGTFVLIISCINFINLTVINGLDRAREVGLRKTVGAFRHQLVVQFMSENMILLVFAGLCSALLLLIAAPFFRDLSGLNLPLNFISSPQILIPLVLILIGLELISGIYPAVLLSGFRPAEIIKPAGSGYRGLKNIGVTRKVLIITQFSLSMILVIGSIIVYNQMSYLKNQDLGFKKDQIMLIKLNGAMRDKLEAFKDAIAGIPGVTNLAISEDVPGYRISMEGMRVPGSTEDIMSRIFGTDEHFLEAYDIEMAQGEYFTNAAPDQRQFIINETMAAMSFGDRNPVGEQLIWRDTGRVVGVVKDFNFQSLHTAVEPLAITRYLDINYGFLSIRFNPQSTDQVLAGIDETGRKIYPDLPRIETEFLDDRFGQLYLAENRLQTIVWFFCLVTVLLTISGIFGVASYNAHKKSKEIAIRKVLGAGSPEMIWQLLKGFVGLLIISLLIGLPGAYYLVTWWLQDFAYQVNVSPFIFIGASFIMLILIFVSSGLVTFRATSVNPATILKNE
ncbi:MAG: FtsX-like permease family protein [Cyclobacteriaceae bacterium]